MHRLAEEHGLPVRTPRTLRDAIDVLTSSAVARRTLGDRFVDCYASAREAEVAAFEQWWATTITDWELNRYLEHL